MVTYCRIRHIGRGDTERAERMREALSAMISRASHAGIKKVDTMIDKVAPEITTNIETKKLTKLLISNLNFKMSGTAAAMARTWRIWSTVPGLKAT